MTKQLHILNGYTTLNLFQEAQISDQVCVWNEILSEGPVFYEIGTDDFWKIRREFVVSTFGQGAAGYDDVITHFNKIRNYQDYEEIILWYEYDLFCQINLMALLSWFYNQNAFNRVKISLICVGREEGYNQLVGLGRLPVRVYPELLERRKELSESNLRFADSVWYSYAGDDPSELAFACVPHPVFNYLSAAIRSHFDRFPDNTGFNEIEKEILRVLSTESKEDVDTVVRHMLQWQKHYGFGDLQYYYYLKSLSPFIEFGDSLGLNNIGEEFSKTGIDRKLYPSLDLPLGGSSASQFNRTGDTLKRISN